LQLFCNDSSLQAGAADTAADVKSQDGRRKRKRCFLSEIEHFVAFYLI